MSGFLSLYNERQTEFLELKNKTISMVRDALDSHRSDTSYVAKSRNILPSNERTRTYIILGELIRGFNLDPNSKIRDNDIIDLIHAISPLNCCDYILLDGPWEERVKKMNNRISKTLINMPIAKCFSKRDNGVELFLSSLESFDKSEHLTAIAHP